MFADTFETLKMNQVAVATVLHVQLFSYMPDELTNVIKLMKKRKKSRFALHAMHTYTCIHTFENAYEKLSFVVTSKMKNIKSLHCTEINTTARTKFSRKNCI